MFEESRRSAHVPNLYVFFFPLKIPCLKTPSKNVWTQTQRSKKERFIAFFQLQFLREKKTIRLYTCTPFFSLTPSEKKRA